MPNYIVIMRKVKLDYRVEVFAESPDAAIKLAQIMFQTRTVVSVGIATNAKATNRIFN